MGLLTQTTDLKSLRYGNDLYQGGSSRQPFVKFKTPNGEALVEEKFGREDLLGQTGGVDQFVRGSALLPQNIALDVERITKFLATPQGLEFVTKQQGLIQGWNKALYGEDSKNWPYDYDPASLLSNTAEIALGNHFSNVVFKTGKKPSDTQNIARENKYGEGNTYSWRTPSAYIAKKSLQGVDPKVLVDNITYAPLYPSSSVDQLYLKDTVNFYITKINNDGSGNNTYIHFRSYISGLSDSYKAEWGSFKYMGRGENFYNYNGFSRDISFKFVVPVLSKYEQASVYSKLNYLASLMAPDYVTNGVNTGFMRGNLVRITIGDYLINVPGIIQGVNYTVPDDATWDIAKNFKGDPLKGEKGLINADADTGGYVMPRLIEVNNFTFIPVHDFIPKTVDPQFVNTGNGKYVDAPFINFGKDGKSLSEKGGYGYTNLTSTAEIANILNLDETFTVK